MKITIILACNKFGGIGLNNKMPWHSKTDLLFFRWVTSSEKSAVIMGSNTFASCGQLKDRLNIILSNKEDNVFCDKSNEYMKSNENVKTNEQIIYSKSIDEALTICNKNNIKTLYVIGGAQIYRLFYDNEIYDDIILSYINDNVKCDTHISFHETVMKHGSLIYSTDDIIRYHYKRPANKDEHGYISLIKDILARGCLKNNRTGIDTLSIFGHTTRYSLENNTFPLLTTKKMFIRGVIEELLWFLSGSTNSKLLEEKGVNIWKGNSSKEFLGNRKLDYEEGDIGPLYGFQWTHWGADYNDFKVKKVCEQINSEQINSEQLDNEKLEANKYKKLRNEGINQIKEIIHTIKTDPDSRRIILSAWNVSDLDKMTISPCHVLAQFYVNNNKLSCQLYQRSADVGLGVPFNIASYALLTIMIAQCTGTIPYEFIHTLGDAHIYKDHIVPLNEQIKREPYSFPKIYIDKPTVYHGPTVYKDKSAGNYQDKSAGSYQDNSQDTDMIFNYKYSDFKIKYYRHHDPISMKMAI